ncbi:MAG: hypothetical protein V9E87_16750 [Gemmatimonadales bacterium]
MPDILLCTLNARYSHASLGLRCLRANLGELRERSAILEFVIGQKTEEIVGTAAGRSSPGSSGSASTSGMSKKPRGWWRQLKTAGARDRRRARADPRSATRSTQQRICALADYVITGWGDVSFRHARAGSCCSGDPPASIG